MVPHVVFQLLAMPGFLGCSLQWSLKGWVATRSMVKWKAECWAVQPSEEKAPGRLSACFSGLIGVDQSCGQTFEQSLL